MAAPRQVLSSLDHFVPQWMSAVTVSDGNAKNASQVHDTGSSTSPSVVKAHSFSGVSGVAPAESSGKSGVTYWLGGTRAGSALTRGDRRTHGKPVALGGPWPRFSATQGRCRIRHPTEPGMRLPVDVHSA